MDYKLIEKFNKSIFAIFLMFLGLSSCIDAETEVFVPPTGNVNGIEPNTLFTTSTDSEDSMSLVFRSYSTDAVSYAWDFGDGGTANTQNPNYTYSEGGLYKVKLSTVSSDGLTAVDSSNVSPMFVDFDITVVDTEVTFTNNSLGLSSLTWAFGDDEILEWESEDTEEDADFSPVHVYKSDEIVTATLIATNYLGDQVSVEKIIEGMVLSTVPDFTFTTDNLTASFFDDSILAESYSWDFGDNSEIVTTKDAVHTYATKGTYNVTLTTTNSAGVSKSITKGVPVGGVEATFAAVILNGTIDEWVPGVYHKDDNNDGWEPVPPSSFKNGQASPYTWSNSALKSAAGIKAAGITTSENSGTHALKFSGPERRAYQPFEVEVGVEYTITMFVRTETTDPFTIFILNNEVSDENDLIGNSDKVYIVADNPNSYVEHTFTFKATTTTAVFYAVPVSTTSGSSEIYLDDISIETPGF